MRNDERGQAQRRFIQQQQTGLAHQRTANGQHLLLAAGHGARALRRTFLQTRKELEHMLNAIGNLVLVQKETAHLQVFRHRQVLEDAAAFRRDGNAAAHDVVGGHLGDVLALEHNAAAAGTRVAAHGHQQRSLARAIAADQGDDLALIDMQTDLVDRADGAIVGGDLLQLQHRLAHQASPR